MASEQDNTQPASSHQTTAARWKRWRGLSVQAQFEHVIVLFLSALIAVVVALTVWSLALSVLAILLQPNTFAAADPTVFQSLFGMMFTVIIALEFRRTLLVITERQQSIVHVRAVVLIAMLAIVRKLIIFDLAGGAAVELFALAAAILALGGVYWLVRDRETRGTASSCVPLMRGHLARHLVPTKPVLLAAANVPFDEGWALRRFV